MKLKTLFSVAIASFATSFAFADQGDVMITFSTPGPDKYADGTTVADGEWYALCWAKDGAFDGLTTDCKAIGENEEMILAAPLAKDGKCPFVAFEFARNTKYDKGKFTVLMLDTRKDGKTPAASLNGLPAFVKETAVAATTAKGSEMSAAADTQTAAGAVAWAQPDVNDAAVQAEVDKNLVKIISFEILDANVKLTVENPPATMVVKSGEALDKMNSYKVAPTVTKDGDTATFIIEKKNAKFFSVGGLK